MSLGTSAFTGSNISKLRWVNEMDEAAELFFDGVFGYGANVFNSLAINDIVSYFEKPMESNDQVASTTIGRQFGRTRGLEQGYTFQFQYSCIT